MVSVLDSGSSGLGSSAGRDYCVVFLGKILDTLFSDFFSPPTIKWIPANCQGNLTKCWGVNCDGRASHPEGVAILKVASCLLLWKLELSAGLRSH